MIKVIIGIIISVVILKWLIEMICKPKGEAYYGRKFERQNDRYQKKFLKYDAKHAPTEAERERARLILKDWKGYKRHSKELEREYLAEWDRQHSKRPD